MINKIDPTVKIYKDAAVIDSILAKNVTIGDFSKVNASIFKENVRIDRNNHIDNSELGKYSYTGKNTVILHTQIGAFCCISWNVSIGGANHDYTRLTQHSFLYNKSDLMPLHQISTYDRYSESVIIGNDVWIAAGAVITRGIKIGDGAVIGANAVVTKDVPPYAIVAGIPAKVIKYRFTPEIIQRLLDIQWWNWEEIKIKENFTLFSEQPTLDNLKGL